MRARMVVFFLLAFGASFALGAQTLSSSLAHPSRPPSVGITSNLMIDKLPTSIQQELKRQFSTELTKVITVLEAEKILKWLHRVLDFDLVQLWEVSENQFEFRVIKRARIKEIHWKGLGPLSESESQRLFGVQSDDVFDEESIATGLARTKTAIEELGYLKVQINSEFVSRPDGHIKIQLTVNEGPQAHIGEIIFESANESLNKSIKRSLNSFFKEPLTQEAIDRVSKAAKEYLVEKRYSRAEISGPVTVLNAEKTSASLKFKIDRIEKYDFQFTGNVRFSGMNLSENLDLSNFYSANSNIGAELAQKIKTFYQKNGYARAEVTFVEKEDHLRFQKNILFEISEGSRIKIDKVQVSGKISREESYYVKLFFKNASLLTQDGYYSREDTEAAATNLKLDLQSQGYLLAKVLTIRTPLARESSRVPILITLEEGPLTEIESVVFTGNQRLSTEDLTRVSGLAVSGPLRLGQIDLAIQNIKNFYRGQGFLEMALENEKADLVTYVQDNTRARIRFKIFEGPQVRIASIVLEGNTFTKDRVLLNEVDFTIGDILTPQKIEDSTYRLQKTGYFGAVEIRTLEEKTAVADRTVVVRVTERDPGLFAMGFGVTNDRKLTVRGYTGIAYRNLRGTGRGLSLRIEGNYNVAEVKYPEYKATVGYLEPYLLESRNRGRVNITRSRLVTDPVYLKASESVQTTFSIERDITTHVVGIWDTYSLSSSRDYFIDPNKDILKGTNTDETLLDIASTGFSIDIDYRNNVFNPTSGNIVKFNMEYASPTLRSSPTIEYWRSTANLTTYHALYKNSVVWTNNLRAGYLQNLNHESDGGVPYDKKGFILGGRSTLRGFEAGTNEVFPNNVDLGISTGATFLLKESAKMGLYKSELAFPLYGVFSGVIFYDGGTVILSERQFEDSYRDSVGFGFRYNTPVGPLCLDLGWKLDRKAGEDTARYHLSFGTF